MKTLLILLALTFIGCSNQELISDSSADDKYVTDLFNEYTQNSSLSNSNQLMDLYDNENSVLYFSEAYDGLSADDGRGDLGTVQSIAALSDFSFMGINNIGINKEYTKYDLKEVQIFFLIDSELNQASILIRMIAPDQTQPDMKVFDNDPNIALDFSGDEFKGVFINNSTGQPALVLRSYELHKSYENQLAPVIQLNVGAFDGSGTEVDIGKFSTLIGFGIN